MVWVTYLIVGYLDTQGWALGFGDSGLGAWDEAMPLVAGFLSPTTEPDAEPIVALTEF